jgi:hypothetical protein
MHACLVLGRCTALFVTQTFKTHVLCYVQVFAKVLCILIASENLTTRQIRHGPDEHKSHAFILPSKRYKNHRMLHAQHEVNTHTRAGFSSSIADMLSAYPTQSHQTATCSSLSLCVIFVSCNVCFVLAIERLRNLSIGFVSFLLVELKK